MKNQIEMSDEMHLYHASLLHYLYSYEAPYGILFPRRLESVQRIMKIASKYDIGVMNTDLNAIGDYVVIKDDEEPPMIMTKPFVVVNQKNIKTLEFDQNARICRCGVGLTVEEINNHLRQYGYEVPIRSSQKRLFTLLNEDEEVLDSSEFSGINEIVKGV